MAAATVDGLVGDLTEEQARAIYRQGEETVIWTLLKLSRERAELAAQVSGFKGTHPSTPSGMIPPYEKPTVKRRRKRPGRPEGHPGARREPPTRIDRRQEHTLKQCPDCGGEVHQPVRQRTRLIEDIPEVNPVTTEHTIHGYYCSTCQKIVEPVVTEALPGSTIGHRLLALTAWLHYGLGTTLSQIVAVLNFHLHFKVSEGGLIQMWRRLQEILYAWYEQIGQEAKTAGVLFADETSWRVSGVLHWLWCFTTDTATYYMIDRSRGGAALKKFFTEAFEGTLVTDFWKVYDRVVCAARQMCLVHLFRELEKVDIRNPSPGWEAFRKRLKRLLKDAFRLDQRNEVPPEEYASKRTRLSLRLDEIIAEPWEDADARRLAKRLKTYHDSIFTFLDQAEVPSDNNHGEREIRPAVIIRKNSLCNRSEEGAHMQAVLMSIYRTLKLRGHNPIDTITQAVAEYVRTGKLPPLPPPTTSHR